MIERGWFLAYLDAFNRGDFEAFGAYYAADIAFFGQAARLNGRDAVLDFYRMVRSRLDETVELLTFHGSADGLAAELRTTLVPHEDWPDFPTGALRKQERRQSINFAFYDVAGSRFTRIRFRAVRAFDVTGGSRPKPALFNPVQLEPD